MINGVTFKGIHSSQFHLVLKSDNRQALSDVTRFTKQVPGYAGVVDFEMDTYDEKALTVILQYNYKNSMTNLMDNVELIGGWLYNDGNYYDLIFDDQPNRKYKAKVVSKVDVRPNSSLASLSIAFVCNPPHPFDLDNNPVSPADVQRRLLWDSASLESCQYMQSFSNIGEMRFTVGGSLPVKPIIKIIGNIHPGLKLTYKNAAWQYNADLLYDGIKIDCAAETVTRLSDGYNLFSHVDSKSGDYFLLQSGQQTIGAYGTSEEVVIFIEFEPMEA